ncbi:type II toxin-antitoxin system RelE family toxin [Spirillospora sp. CA-294931]
MEDLRRIRVGRYRVLYEIDPAIRAIMVLHVGRLAELSR